MTTTTTATCTVCGRSADQPYRRRVSGRVTEGCVASYHDKHADAWHDRPEARRVRAATPRWDDGRSR